MGLFAQAFFAAAGRVVETEAQKTAAIPRETPKVDKAKAKDHYEGEVRKQEGNGGGNKNGW